MKKNIQPRKSVLVAMSGGVDSSVAALLLHQSGYVVAGVTLTLWKEPSTSATCVDGTDASLKRAGEICKILGIDHFVIDRQRQFFTKIIEPFLLAYTTGSTPNPCWSCNRMIKWASLMAIAKGKGFDLVATGHYARIIQGAKRVELWKGVDENKEQSYYLSGLTANELQKTILPLGELTKDQVRTLASKNGLPVVDAKDSQDLCFLTDSNYRYFIRKFFPDGAAPGEIVDNDGNVLGAHAGLIDYTIGQRKRIRIASHEPLYVIRKDVKENRLIVGKAADLGRKAFTIHDVNYLQSIDDREYQVKVRYRSRAISAHIQSEGPELSVSLDHPALDLAPGQIAVAYDGDRVAVSGVISVF
jgi:tRNA-specific 2-thiouridylase